MKTISATIIGFLSLMSWYKAVSSSASGEFRTRTLTEVSQIKNMCSDMVLYFRDVQDEKCWNIHIMSMYTMITCITLKPNKPIIGRGVKNILEYRVFPLCPDFTKCPSRLHLGIGCQQIIAAKVFRLPSWRPKYLYNENTNSLSLTTNSSTNVNVNALDDSSREAKPWFSYILCNTKKSIDHICFDYCFIDDTPINGSRNFADTLMGCTDKETKIQENHLKSKLVIICSKDYCNRIYFAKKNTRLKYICQNDDTKKLDKCILCRVEVRVVESEFKLTHSLVKIRYDCFKIGFNYNDVCLIPNKTLVIAYRSCCQGNYCNLKYRKMCFVCKKDCIERENLKIEERKYDHYQCFIENIGDTLIYGITEKCLNKQICCHGNLCNKKTIVCSSCDNQTVSECGVGSLCMTHFKDYKMYKCGCSKEVKDSRVKEHFCLNHQQYCCNTDKCKIKIYSSHSCFTNSGNRTCPGSYCKHSISKRFGEQKDCIFSLLNACPFRNSAIKMCCYGMLCNYHKLLECYNCPNGEINCRNTTLCLAGTSSCLYSYRRNGIKSMSCKFNCTSKTNEDGIDVCCKDDLCNEYREHCLSCTNPNPKRTSCRKKDISIMMCFIGYVCYKTLQGNGTSSYHSQMGCTSSDECDSIEDENGKIIKNDSSTKSSFQTQCCQGNKCNKPKLKLCFMCDDSSIDRMLRCSEGGYLLKGFCHSIHYCSVTRKRYTLKQDWFYIFGCSSHEFPAMETLNSTVQFSTSINNSTEPEENHRTTFTIEEYFGEELYVLSMCKGELCNTGFDVQNITCFGIDQTTKQCHGMDKCGFEERKGILTYGCFQRFECHKKRVTCCVGDLCNKKQLLAIYYNTIIWSIYFTYMLVFTATSSIYIWPELLIFIVQRDNTAKHVKKLDQISRDGEDEDPNFVYDSSFTIL